MEYDIIAELYIDQQMKAEAVNVHLHPQPGFDDRIVVTNFLSFSTDDMLKGEYHEVMQLSS